MRIFRHAVCMLLFVWMIDEYILLKPSCPSRFFFHHVWFWCIPLLWWLVELCSDAGDNINVCCLFWTLWPCCWPACYAMRTMWCASRMNAECYGQNPAAVLNMSRKSMICVCRVWLWPLDYCTNYYVNMIHCLAVLETLAFPEFAWSLDWLCVAEWFCWNTNAMLFDWVCWNFVLLMKLHMLPWWLNHEHCHEIHVKP